MCCTAWSASRPAISISPMWLTSNNPARVRTARCSSTMPEYSTGMSQPANGTIFAPEARCRALSGVFLRDAALVCSMERRRTSAGTSNGTMRVQPRSRNQPRGLLFSRGFNALDDICCAAEIGLERVIADAEHATCFALVAVHAIDDEADVAGRPHAQRVVAR